jgi:tRNA-uridine 2-sulfurtransferase
MSKILVWLSWGVDSAVSAYLLREQGHEVACGYMINYLDEENPTCPTRVDLEEARRVAEFLGLPFYTFDYREEYESRIVDYIYREYEMGHTPNPDVFCNNLVKFDLFLEEALSLGFDAIAMGHYARVQDGRLFKWVDPLKDQSYFLSRLSQFQLSHALFPIGDLEKSEVREIAREAKLPNADRKDSQGLCFIGKVSMKEFLEKRFPKKPGNILDQTGKIVGTHEWAYSYTIGQRKGIEIGGGPALFVTAKDTVANTITVGGEADLHLFTLSCTLTDWVWSDIMDWKQYNAKIRYRQEDQKCEIKVESGKWKVEFQNPQRAIAAWQICVIYDGDMVVGSGVMS